MARTAFVALACLATAANALEVVSPSAGLGVFADRTYTVEWTGTTDGRFEIDLYMCGSMCMEDDCGTWVTALCPYGEDGCPDSEGDYDLVMPEPMSGTSGEGYKIMVKNAMDESDMDCSDAFTLVASSESPAVGEDGYMLTVTSPEAGDVAMAGEEYTIEWDYENGLGSKVDRFSIDLYMVESEGRRLQAGDCGTYVTSLCDKPEIGCKDSMGDYDIEIPEGIASGMYSIRVGRFEDPALFGCSAPFMIEGDDDMSMSYRF